MAGNRAKQGMGDAQLKPAEMRRVQAGVVENVLSPCHESLSHPPPTTAAQALLVLTPPSPSLQIARPLLCLLATSPLRLCRRSLAPCPRLGRSRARGMRYVQLARVELAPRHSHLRGCPVGGCDMQQDLRFHRGQDTRVQSTPCLRRPCPRVRNAFPHSQDLQTRLRVAGSRRGCRLLLITFTCRPSGKRSRASLPVSAQFPLQISSSTRAVGAIAERSPMSRRVPSRLSSQAPR